MKKMILFIITVLISYTATAANSGWVKMTGMITDDKGHISVYVNAAYKPTSSCPSPNRYVLAGNNAAFKNNYAMLLTTWVQGGDIYLALKNNECIYSSPTIDWIRIR